VLLIKRGFYATLEEELEQGSRALERISRRTGRHNMGLNQGPMQVLVFFLRNITKKGGTTQRRGGRHSVWKMIQYLPTLSI